MSLLLLFQGTPSANVDLANAEALLCTISDAHGLTSTIANTGLGVTSAITSYHAIFTHIKDAEGLTSTIDENGIGADSS